MLGVACDPGPAKLEKDHGSLITESAPGGIALLTRKQMRGFFAALRMTALGTQDDGVQPQNDEW